MTKNKHENKRYVDLNTCIVDIHNIRKEEITHKRRCAETPKVVLTVMEALKGKGIEDAIKLDCVTENAANRLFGVLSWHNKHRKLGIGVSRSMCSVYAFKVEQGIE